MENKKQVTITVSGEFNSGKSRILKFIKDSLRHKGFNVEFDGGLDAQTENEFNRRMNGKDVDLLVDMTGITIEEKQLSRT